MTTFLVTAGMIILFVLGIPVGYSLGIAGMLAYLNELGSRVNIPRLTQRMQYGVNNFLLLAIPLFILAACNWRSNRREAGRQAAGFP